MTVANWPRGRDAKENAKEEEAPRTSVTSTLTERRYKRPLTLGETISPVAAVYDRR
jgi:hypothetical protein